MDADLELGRFKKDHVCTLPPDDDIVVRYIDSGFLVETRRKLKRLLTVSETNPRAKNYLKSRHAIRQEKARHLKHYYYMLHPFSEARSIWEFFMMFVFFSLLSLIPIEITTLKYVWYLKIPKFCLDILCCIDICVTFVTGYYDVNQRRVILNIKLIAKNYLMRYFFIDLISSIPVDMALIFIGKDESMWWVKMLTLLKVLRITTLIKYLNRFCTRMEYSLYKYKLLKLTILFVLGILWATCIAFLIGRLSLSTWLLEESMKEEVSGLVLSCYRAIYNLLLVGYGTEPLKEIPDIIVTMMFLCCGYVLELYIYAQMMMILNKDSSSTNKYQQLLQQLTEYVRYKELPERLRKRIVLYFEYKYQRRFFKEQEIMTTISGELRREIILHTCGRLLHKVEYFQNLPASLLLRISTGMRTEIYLANDVIIRAGDVGDSMYFISSGSVAVYSPSGTELCHLSDGNHFGELAVITDNEKRVVSVVAVECCELLVLKAAEYRKAVQVHPEQQERILRLVLEKLRMATEAHAERRQEAEESADGEDNA